jgi:hypothetical protein
VDVTFELLRARVDRVLATGEEGGGLTGARTTAEDRFRPYSTGHQQTSRRVHPACHQSNLNLQVSGPEVSAGERHRKLRCGGYRGPGH